MFGGLMIGDFCYNDAPSSDAVVVDLHWHSGEGRMGTIRVPSDLERAIVQNGLPSLEPLPIISAIAYAMVIAAQNDRNLLLSGDRSVWPKKWGTLVSAH